MNLVNSSIVFVLAEGTGARDFLVQQYKSNGIIPKEFSPLNDFAGSKIEILPIIELQGGYNLQFIQNKVILQINYNKPIDLNKDEMEDKLEEISKNFYVSLGILPVVQLGINFKVLKVDSSLEQYKISNELQLTQIKVEKYVEPFTAKVDFIQTNAIDNQEKVGLLISANFHKVINDVENLNDMLSHRNNCLNKFKDIIRDVTN